jgi:hypothetical protein
LNRFSGHEIGLVGSNSQTLLHHFGKACGLFLHKWGMWAAVDFPFLQLQLSRLLFIVATHFTNTTLALY